MVWGAISFQKLPIDAYPDLSPPHVEIITQWPGHAAEEVERLVTHPTRNRNERHSAAGFAAFDFALRALVGADELRVRRRPLLRARAGLRAGGQRHPALRRDARAFAAVQPQRPDLPLCGAEPRPHAAGSEDHRRLGAGTRTTAPFRAWPTIPASAAPPCNTRCCSTPTSCSRTASPCRRWCSSWAATTPTAGGGFYSQGGQFYYIRGLGLVRDTTDIGNIVLAVHNGIPVYVQRRRARCRSATRRGSASSAT